MTSLLGERSVVNIIRCKMASKLGAFVVEDPGEDRDKCLALYLLHKRYTCFIRCVELPKSTFE